EKQHEIVIELGHTLGTDRHRTNVDGTVGSKHDVVEPAERRRDLVLRADGLAYHVLLDVDALVRELALARHLSFERVEGVQQPDRKRRARSHPASRRQVAVVVNLYSSGDPGIAEDFTRGGVLDLIEGMAVLDLRIDEANRVLEERRQMPAGEIAILVDGRRQHCPTVLVVP